ncbi:MAG: DEAD/DEAH box helicase family protein, partial [Deltaproteobacteria bacterium]|nr:DEAD/DEAH box helicase family protein [Deltaproteobacteria bacterium]
MDFPQILAKYRAGATSESDKGAKFEKLMVNFLKTYQIYDQRFERVWRWRDFPFRDEISCRDVGIDLVAKTPEGDYWAVQCKCYQEGAHINKHTLDSFLGPSGRTFKDDSGRQLVFTNRLWISTTNDWTSEAEAELRNQTIPCARISLSDLENARVDWEKLDQGLFGNQARLAGRKTLPHQTEAIEACAKGFKTHDRGRLILACGTGKTFTALKIAERETDGQGLILFLAPSIALIGQSLREWAGDAAKPFQAICVCSDPGVSRSKNKNPLDEDMAGVEDLALPATTDVATIAARLNEAGSRHPGRMRVIFSTYQSIDRVAEALKRTKMTVDLIVCDEAHRTTGVTLADEDESHFVKVHDNGFIKAHKRLYMTATPRVFGEKAKEKAEGASIALCSMDDETLYGPEFHHLGFGEAVDRNLLSDYKVLILTVRRGYVPAKDEDGKDIKEVDADMVTRLIGCLNALSKNLDNEGEFLRSVDPGQMHRAVAFCRTILKSKEITSAFNRLKATFGDRLKPPEGHELVDVVADHIDGGMGSSARDAKMAWLKAQTENPNECRVLDNVKCLSEGVDVPSLDAVMFLSAKNSQIDIVQSVGRVMRKAEGKKFGYAIIPVLIPNHVDPKEVLDDHQNFKVVWYVLNALKSHDDRFTSIINQIQFNEPGDDPDPDRERKHRRSDQIIVDGIEPFDLLAEARKIDFVLHEAIYARLVKKVGSRQDMSDWAADVAKIADGFKGRITKVVNRKGPHKEEFDKFLQGLRQTLNPSVDAAEAIEMLAQHLISKPVFTALFANYAFVKHNPVSQSLEAMIDVLDDQGLEADRAGHDKLDRFFHNVQEQVAGIDNPAGKQKIMDRLYDHFFKLAMPKAVDKLGIVYTPVEIVDFIVHSVAETLKREFGRSISDENVHILDPFAGTGTFVSRLIQSGLLGDSLERKYKSEIHANEIVLLAYYIANVSIESAYHTAMGANAPYRQFNGICLTDTFQLYETRTGDMFAKERLKKNTQRVRDQEKAPIQIIFGNPPFSAGQRSANDNSKNQSYPALEKTIVMTYASKSSAQNKNALYDSYIKAFRWSSDRLGRDGGIIAFVSNSGWLDGNAMDGMRKCLSDEFSKIYVFNLRGNCRTSGELRRKEAGNIFGLGSRTPIAITVLVKKPELQGPAEIYHYDIGDYLSREEKLAVVAEKHDIY